MRGQVPTPRVLYGFLDIRGARLSNWDVSRGLQVGVFGLPRAGPVFQRLIIGRWGAQQIPSLNCSVCARPQTVAREWPRAHVLGHPISFPDNWCFLLACNWRP